MAFKRSKYKAIKFNGYDSKKEHKEALELRLMEKAGIIKDLIEQPKFELLASFRDNQGKLERSICYIGDFQYYDNEKKCIVVKDTKSEFTCKLPVYIMKRKMFKFKYPDILFLESIK